MVTGASRGVGRGIALVLAECGATVYATGRDPAAGAARRVVLWTGEEKPVTESLAETAALGTARGSARGGRVIPVHVDHTRDDEVEALFGRVAGEHGRLDLLVNNAWGGYENMERFGAPFWEQPRWRWDAMFGAGARASFVASQLGARLMVPRRRGLIASTTVAWPDDQHDRRLVYSLAKQTANRMVWAIAQELREHGVAAVGLSPVGFRDGWVSSGEELRSVYAALEAPGGLEALYRATPRLLKGQTPEYAGRAVARLAADDGVLAKSGRVLKVRELAEEYGFTDLDGRRPEHD